MLFSTYRFERLLYGMTIIRTKHIWCEVEIWEIDERNSKIMNLYLI